MEFLLIKAMSLEATEANSIIPITILHRLGLDAWVLFLVNFLSRLGTTPSSLPDRWKARRGLVSLELMDEPGD
jgi:hypothetical protein